MLTWTERAPTRDDPRAWEVTPAEPDEHPLSARYPDRRLHRVQLADLEEHWALDAAIVASGLKMIETVRDDGRGGHVWFEEIPGWAERATPTLARQLVRETASTPAKRSHHKRRAP